MGKKRIAVVGEEKAKKERRVVKTGKEHGRIADVGAQALAEATSIEEKTKKLEKEIVSAETKTGKKVKAKPSKKRGAKYLQALKKVNRKKFYPLSEAIKLLQEISISQFKGSVDVHLVTRKPGLKGDVEFPHDTGKKQTIRIADEALLKELEKGKITFTALVTTPVMMPKLAKYAKILGPKGLMPNPKTGTITDHPEALVKKMAGKSVYKTETKAPLIHLTIGKIDFPAKKLTENFTALIKAVGRNNLKKAIISPSMGPGIKVDLRSVQI